MDKTVDKFFEDAIAIIKAATGLTVVIRGDQDAPAPTGEYASVTLIEEDTEGIHATEFNLHEEEEGDPVSIDVISHGISVAAFSVQFFRGTGPMERARKLRNYASTPWGRELLQQKAVSLRSASSATRTDYQIAQKWIPRVSMQIVLAASSEAVNTVPIIGEVELTVNGAETHVVK